mgnify:CR=1 FL=1
MNEELTEKQRRSAAAEKAWVTRRRRKAIAHEMEQARSWIWREYEIHGHLDECFQSLMIIYI